MTVSIINQHSQPMLDVYIKDYQGNIRAVYNQDDVCIVQQTDYYPYGLPKATSIGAEANPFKYGGKELNTHLPQPFYDFTARMQLPQLCLFQRPDPKATDYTWLNPFTYCAGDPVNKIDPNGCIVKVLDEASANNIKNTLTIEESKFVCFIDGYIDKNLLNKCNSNSDNMIALIALANSDLSYNFITSSEFAYKDGTVKFSDNGIIGITVIPNAPTYPSADENIYIFTSDALSLEGQVSNTAHEAYGHAYFNELKHQGVDVNPYHDYGNRVLPPEIDPETGLEGCVFEKYDKNIELAKQIKRVETQAIQNLKTRIP